MGQTDLRVFNNAKVSDHHAIIPTGIVRASRRFQAQNLHMVARHPTRLYPAAQGINHPHHSDRGQPFKTEENHYRSWLEGGLWKRAAGEDEQSVFNFA
jgi:hypothetical protein